MKERVLELVITQQTGKACPKKLFSVVICNAIKPPVKATSLKQLVFLFLLHFRALMKQHSIYGQIVGARFIYSVQNAFLREEVM